MYPLMQYYVTTNQKLWKAAMLKIVMMSPYLSKKSCNFDEIWYKTADLEPNDSHVTKYENFY